MDIDMDMDTVIVVRDVCGAGQFLAACLSVQDGWGR